MSPRILSVAVTVGVLGLGYVRAPLGRAQPGAASTEEDSDRAPPETPAPGDDPRGRAGPKERSAAPEEGSAGPEERSAGPDEASAGPEERSAGPEERSAAGVEALDEGAFTLGEGELALEDLDEAELTVDEVEVTASELTEAERLEQSSAPVEVVDMEAAHEEAADMGDILNRSRSVTVQRAGGLGSRQTLCLHGLCDQQVRIFVDGVPLDFYGFGSRSANLPVSLVERIEIYRGVIPLRLGADSLGGALDFITRSEPERGGFTSYRLGSFGTRRFAAGGTYADRDAGWFVRARAFYDQTDNDYSIEREISDERGRPETRHVERFHDEYVALGAMIDAGAFDQGWADELSLRLHYVDAFKELQNNTSGSRAFGDAHASDRTFGATLRYQVGDRVPDLEADVLVAYAKRASDLVDQGTKIYDWSGTVRGERDEPGEIVPGQGGFLQTAYTDRVLARANIAYDVAQEHTLRFNVTSNHARRDGENRLESNPLPGLEAGTRLTTLVSALGWKARLFDARLETLVFAKAYQLWSNGRRIIAGEDLGGVTQRDTAPGWGAQLVFWATDHLALKSSYERTLRFPRPIEAFGDGLLTLPNGELEGERSHNVNAGLMLDWPESQLGQLHFQLTGLARLTDDEIRIVIEDPFRRYENVAETRALGAEGSSRWTSRKRYVSVGGGVTYLDARSQAGAHEGSRIPNRPYLFANASLEGRLDALLPDGMHLRGYLRYRYVHSFFRFWADVGAPGTKDVVPEQHVTDIGVAYDLWDGALGVTVEVRNALDATLFDVVGVERPGRAAFVQLRAETR